MIGAANDENLTPLKRAALVTVTSLLLDQPLDDLSHLSVNGDVAGTSLVKYLPHAFAPRSRPGSPGSSWRCTR